MSSREAQANYDSAIEKAPAPGADDQLWGGREGPTDGILGGTRHTGFDDRRGQLILTVTHVELVDPLHVASALASARNQKDGIGCGVNYWCALDANVADDIQAVIVGNVVDRHGRDAGHLVGKAAHPQGRAGTVSIESVHLVVHGGSIEHVAHSTSRDRYGWKVQGLGKDSAIHVVAIELAEAGPVNVGRVEDVLVRVGRGAGLVVAVHHYWELGAERKCRGECQYKTGQRFEHLAGCGKR